MHSSDEHHWNGDDMIVPSTCGLHEVVQSMLLVRSLRICDWEGNTIAETSFSVQELTDSK